MKKKNYPILILSLALVFVSVNFVLAQFQPEMEIERYPVIGTQTVTATTTLPEYIIYMFNLGLIVGVVIVIGMIVWAGFLHLTSAGNPTQLKDAKSRLFNGFLGLIILFGSYLILNTVNPQLTVIRLELVRHTRGILLVDGAKKEYTGVDVKNIQEKFGHDFQPQTIKFVEASLGEIRVIAYPESGFEGIPKTFTDNGSTSWPIRSVKLQGIGPGIYLATYHPIFSPPPERLYLTASIPHLGDFNDKAKFIEFKDSFSNGEIQTHFLAILHSDAYYKGGLKIFFQTRDGGYITNTTPTSTSGVPIENKDAWGEIPGGRGLPSSAQVFQLDASSTNCKEVQLYKATNFAGEPALAGQPVDPEKVCVLSLEQPAASPKSIPIYTPKTINSVCGSGWNDEVRSIKVDPPGKCLVVLFGNESVNVGGDGNHNEVFTQSDPDLSDNSIGQCKPGGVIWWSPRPCASAIAVYPLK